MNLLLRIVAVIGLGCALASAQATDTARVLRVPMLSDATTLDPAKASDIYSAEVAENLFETLYTYDYLARPLQVKPLTAMALPEVADNFRQYTIRLQPGILFTDDPAFQGRPRELIAADYVYAIKRILDPQVKSPHLPDVLAWGVVGLKELGERARSSGRPFDYDSPIAGLQALDRYTLRIQLQQPAPRLVHQLAAMPTMAVAREVVQAYGEQLGDHPVGTGPFRLQQWRRGSQLVLARNPQFRKPLFDADPPPGNTEAQAAAQALRGRSLPLSDRIEVAIVEEDQPRWLAFLGGEFDLCALPYPFAATALRAGRLAPHLARQGLQAHFALRPDVIYTFFNMDDPVVGGYAPAQVALRRAISLGYDNQEEIRVVRHGLALPAQSIVPPNTYGYDPALHTEMSEFDLARAQALLDLHGFVDRNGDGWRDRPDGSPLVLVYASANTLRNFQELWQRRMDALHIRIQFTFGQWTEQNKAAHAGQLMMWALAWNADEPDGGSFLRLAYGPGKGGSNLSRFDLPAYNQAFEQLDALPDGPERLRAMRQANRWLLAYMPIKAHVHRIGVTLSQPWVHGLVPNPFLRSIWQFLDAAPHLPDQAAPPR